MRKTYSNFLNEAVNEALKAEDDLEKEYKKAIEKAEKHSRSGDREWYVYQDKITGKVEAFDDKQDLERNWLLGTSYNGSYTQQMKPNKLEEEYKQELQAIDELLTFAGRRGLKRAAKRRKSRLAISRKQAKRRTAPMAKITNRAQRRARRRIAAHLLGGKSKANLSHTGLNRIQQMVNARSGMLDQLRRKLVPQVRKDDRARKRKT